MTTWTVKRAAAALLEREDSRADGKPLTDEWPDLDLATAYAIQDETLRLRQARGETLIGVKLGLTSRAKQRRMNVDSPLTAWLTDAMVLPAGSPLRWTASSIHAWNRRSSSSSAGTSPAPVSRPRPHCAPWTWSWGR